MRVLDLFSGACGGWSLGLHRAGFVTVAAVEIDPWRRAVFQRQFPKAKMYADVRELSATRLIGDLGYLPDVVVGSPPCQEISAANSKGAGITDDHLFWEWVRLVFEIRPLWCGAENSPRARTSGIDGILDALEKAGYASWPCVVGADNAGANHRRKRLWLVAADANRIGSDAGGALWRAAGEGRADSGGHAAADPDDASRRQPSLQDGTAADHRSSTDPDGPRYQVGPRQPGNDGPELPPALRDIGLAWPHWNRGLAGLAAACAATGFGALDDGAEFGLPAGLRNRAIAALGDSVLPQITGLIGRAIMRASHVPSPASGSQTTRQLTGHIQPIEPDAPGGVPGSFSIPVSPGTGLTPGGTRPALNPQASPGPREPGYAFKGATTAAGLH
jgi:site-specific DNA-cytosine methylase